MSDKLMSVIGKINWLTKSVDKSVQRSWKRRSRPRKKGAPALLAKKLPIRFIQENQPNEIFD
jgi:hypothetical protein